MKGVCIEVDLAGGGTDPKLALAPVVGDPVRIPVGREICVRGAGGEPLGGTPIQLQPVSVAEGARCDTCWIVKVIDPTTIRVYWQDTDGTPRTTDITPGRKTTFEPGGRLMYGWLLTKPDGSLMLCIAGA